MPFYLHFNINTTNFTLWFAHKFFKTCPWDDWSDVGTCRQALNAKIGTRAVAHRVEHAHVITQAIVGANLDHAAVRLGLRSTDCSCHRMGAFQ